MSPIDWTLLLAVIAAAGWRIIAPAGRWLLPSLGVLVALAVIQLLLEEFFWQFLPAYLVIAALGVSAIRLRSKPRAWLLWGARAGLAVLIGLAVAPFTLLVPVPVLPAPTGPYAVGTEIYRWVDVSRDEPATPNPSDRRNVIAQAWYPAMAPGSERSVYMDGLGELPPTVVLFPRFMLRSYDRIDTHATLNAEVSNQKLWPVVMFSPGFGAPRAWYTGLAVNLASRGYVVLALDHAYESAVTQLADGTIAAKIDTSPVDVGARDSWMAEQLNIRASDVRFALDRLVEGAGRLNSHLDLSRVAAIGHSFGGATAVAASRDARIAAVANIDGTPYGELPVLQRPFVLLQSDYAVTSHGDSFMERNKRLLEEMSAPAWRYEILRANHVMFMDAPRFFAPPALWVLSKIFSGENGGDLFGGNRGALETQRAAVDILDAFIRETLVGESGAVASAVARYSEIKGGRIEKGAPTS